jgi:hypothetical protein
VGGQDHVAAVLLRGAQVDEARYGRWIVHLLTDRMTGDRVAIPGIGSLSAADLVDLLRRLWDGRPASTGEYRPLALTDCDQLHLSDVANPLWDVARWVPSKREAGQGQPQLDLDLRLLEQAGLSTVIPSSRELRRRYGYTVVSPGDVSWLAEALAGQDVVELGAGNAYLSWQLQQAEMSVTPTDLGESRSAWCTGPEFTDVMEIHAAEAVLAFPDHVLLTCWPAPRSGYTADAVGRYRGDKLVYCGSRNEAYTDPGLLRELAANWRLVDESPWHVSWARAEDFLGVFTRK